MTALREIELSRLLELPQHSREITEHILIMETTTEFILGAAREFGARKERGSFKIETVSCKPSGDDRRGRWLKVTLQTWYRCDPGNSVELGLWETHVLPEDIGGRPPQFFQKLLEPEIAQWKAGHSDYRIIGEFPFFERACRKGLVQFRVARFVLYQEP